MKHNQQTVPFINVRTQENRTPTGRRTSTPARQAALYYAFGNERNVRDQQVQLEERQRGDWLGPDGRIHTHEEVMAWVKAEAMNNRYMFQGILSVAEGEVTPEEFCRAMQRAGGANDWRLISHDDTKHRHAHVMWFGDKRMAKNAFLSWQTGVRAELVQLEQQNPMGSFGTGLKERLAEQETANEAGHPHAKESVLDSSASPVQALSKGQEVDLGW